MDLRCYLYIVFTAYGVGTLATGQIRDWFGTYIYAFYPMAALAIVDIGVACLMLRRDRTTAYKTTDLA